MCPRHTPLFTTVLVDVAAERRHAFARAHTDSLAVLTRVAIAIACMHVAGVRIRVCYVITAPFALFLRQTLGSAHEEPVQRAHLRALETDSRHLAVKETAGSRQTLVPRHTTAIEHILVRRAGLLLDTLAVFPWSVPGYRIALGLSQALAGEDVPMPRSAAHPVRQAPPLASVVAHVHKSSLGARAIVRVHAVSVREHVLVVWTGNVRALLADLCFFVHSPTEYYTLCLICRAPAT